MMKKVVAILASMTVLCAYACGKPEIPQTPKEKETPEQAWAKKVNSFESSMTDYMESRYVVGLCLMITRADTVYYKHYFGYKDKDTKESIDDKTLFRIASISKSFSATALMQLIDQGKVTLDTDVSTLLPFNLRNPSYPDVPITLEMLLDHTSSISDYMGYGTLDVINPSKYPNSYKKCYRSRKPGTGYEYCNMNYSLCGAIIEKLSGERFDKYIYNHILKPMGIDGGFCCDDLDAARFATIYKVQSGGTATSSAAYSKLGSKLNNYRIGYDAPMFSPAGGMKISAPDLARYMNMHRNYGYCKETDTRIIREDLAKDMQRYRTTNEYYGLGLRHEKDYISGVDLVGHTGGAYGLYSAMYFNKDDNYGFVFITNGIYDNTTVIAPFIQKLYSAFLW